MHIIYPPPSGVLGHGSLGARSSQGGALKGGLGIKVRLRLGLGSGLGLGPWCGFACYDGTRRSAYSSSLYLQQDHWICTTIRHLHFEVLTHLFSYLLSLRSPVSVRVLNPDYGFLPDQIEKSSAAINMLLYPNPNPSPVPSPNPSRTPDGSSFQSKTWTLNSSYL